jgi:hypothetical protein
MRRTTPSFESTKSPVFSNLMKCKGFGRLYEGLVKNRPTGGGRSGLPWRWPARSSRIPVCAAPFADIDGPRFPTMPGPQRSAPASHGAIMKITRQNVEIPQMNEPPLMPMLIRGVGGEQRTLAVPDRLGCTSACEVQNLILAGMFRTIGPVACATPKVASPSGFAQEIT